MERAMEERRSSPRVTANGAEVKFRRLRTTPAGVPDGFHEGHIVDISRGGMCFYAGQSLDRGEKIDYAVTSHSGEHNRDGVARVIHVHSNSDLFFVGVEFLA